MTLHNPIGRPRKYPFADMATGDTKFYPLVYGTIRDLQNRLKTSAQKHGQFATQRVMSGGVLGVKVVRT